MCVKNVGVLQSTKTPTDVKKVLTCIYATYAIGGNVQVGLWKLVAEIVDISRLKAPLFAIGAAGQFPARLNCSLCIGEKWT